MAVIGIGPVWRDGDQVTAIRVIDTVEVGVVGDVVGGVKENASVGNAPRSVALVSMAPALSVLTSS